MTHWPLDNEDKLRWCALGEEQEIKFINAHSFKDTVLSMNPEKDLDKYTFDMRINMPCDLKTIRTPWIYAQDKFGIDPKHAVSINQKDLRRYAQLYPNIVIVFDVRFAGYEAIHFGTISHFQTVRRFEFVFNFGLPPDGQVVQFRLCLCVPRHVQQHILRIDVRKLLGLGSNGDAHEHGSQNRLANRGERCV